MLWLKALHVTFMVTWFAGLFYLPRLFVYHSTTSDEAGRARFATMERRLFAIMTIGAVLTIGFGLAMLWRAPEYLDLTWLRIKLVLVALLIGYHWWCYPLMSELANDTGRRSERWYRWFNEVPGILLIAVVLLAVLKPTFD
jgi:protoporphyrinogen IX oxidase